MAKSLGVGFILLLFCGSVSAESYLCIADQVGGVKTYDSGKMKASIYAPEPYKYVMTQNDGNWTVKRLKTDYPAYEQCATERYCQDIAGHFMRWSNGTFTFVSHGWINNPGGKGDSVVGRGHCTKLD